MNLIRTIHNFFTRLLKLIGIEETKQGLQTTASPVASSFNLWPNATPPEQASWAFWKQIEGFEPECLSGDAPHLPLTYREEMELLDALEREFTFTGATPQQMLDFLWRRALKLARQARQEAHRTKVDGRGLSDTLNRRLLTDGEFFSAPHRINEQDLQINLSELERSPLTIAAGWCLLQGAVRLDKRGLNAGQFKIDLQTFLDRCGSLRQTCQSISSVFEALEDNPDLNPKYIRAILNKRRRAIEAQAFITSNGGRQ